MNEIKHTPGPWEWVNNDHWRDQPRLVGGENGQSVVIDLGVDDLESTCGQVFSDADKRLIAAAPELLEALQMVLANCAVSSAVRAVAEVSIKKALGE